MDKLEESQMLMNTVTTEFDLDQIKIISISHGHRWTLEDRVGLGPEMITIERRLQELSMKPVDLRVLAKADKNKRFDRNYLRGIEKL